MICLEKLYKTPNLNSKKRNLLVIGAGASLGARIPRPPDGTQLLCLIKKVLIALSEALPLDPVNYYAALAQRYGDGTFFSKEEIKDASDFIDAAIATGNGYETAIAEVMGKTDTDGKEILLLLNRLIAFAFCFGPENLGPQLSCFQPKRDVYDVCIDRLKIDSSWSVVSLNYDMLFEQALFRKGISYCFAEITAGLAGDKSGLALYKIHGSINWFPVHPQTLHTETPTEEEKRRATRGLSWDDTNKRVSMDFPDIFATDYTLIYQQLVQNRKLERCPVMAHYGPKKPVDVNFGVIDRVRKASVTCSTSVDRAVIIGVRPVTVEDDPKLHEIFNGLRGKDVTYVNPSSSDAAIVSANFGFSTTIKTFEEWLEVSPFQSF